MAFRAASQSRSCRAAFCYLTKEIPVSHKYSMGQLVNAAAAHFADRTSGTYEVIRLMPENSSGELGYRIRDTVSGAQRAVGESEIRAADAKPAEQAH
jgi:hypothetical protein